MNSTLPLSFWVILFALPTSLFAQWVPSTTLNLQVSTDSVVAAKSIGTSSGHVYVAYWKVNEGTPNLQLKLQVLTNTGEKLLGDTGKLIQNNIPFNPLPDNWDLAVDSNQHLILAYNLNGTFISVQRLDINGEKQWGNNGINVASGTRPKLLVLSDNHTILYWNTTGTSEYQKIAPSGLTVWPSPKSTSAGLYQKVETGRLIKIPSGGYYHVYKITNNYTTTTYHFYAKRHNANGDAVWTRAVHASTTSVSDFPSLLLHNENLYVGYVGKINANSPVRAYLQRLNYEGGVIIWDANGQPLLPETGDQFHFNPLLSPTIEDNKIAMFCNYQYPASPLVGVRLQVFDVNDGTTQISQNTTLIGASALPNYTLGNTRVQGDNIWLHTIGNNTIFCRFISPLSSNYYGQRLQLMATSSATKRHLSVAHLPNNQNVVTWTEDRDTSGQQYIFAHSVSCTPPDTVDFTYNLVNNKTIYLTPKVSNAALAYYNYIWDYGDGTAPSSTIHTYQNSGSYNLCMKAINVCNDTFSVCKIVEINCDTINPICRTDTLKLTLLLDCVAPLLNASTFVTNNALCDLDWKIYAPDSTLRTTEFTPADIGTIFRGVATQINSDSSCTSYFQIVNNTSIIAKCRNGLVVYLDEDGKATLYPDSIDNGSIGSCAAGTYLKIGKGNIFNDFSTVDCSQLSVSSNSMGLLVSSVPFNSDTVSTDTLSTPFKTCSTTLIVLDTIAPTCIAGPQTITCEYFDINNLAAYENVTISDNCTTKPLTKTTTTNFDPVCRTGTVVNTWKAEDTSGNSSTCSQVLTVTHNQDYWIKFPDDIYTTVCNADLGQPQLNSVDCERMSITYTDEYNTHVPDACFWLMRTWKVINTCTYDSTQPLIHIPNPNPSPVSNHPTNLPGVTVSPVGTLLTGWHPTVVKISPVDPAATNYGTFWQKEANGYTYTQVIKYTTFTPTPANVSFPSDSMEIAASTQDSAVFWNEPSFWDPIHSTNNLCEAEVDIPFQVAVQCRLHSLKMFCNIYLDLNNDGTQETRVTLEPNTVKDTLLFNYNTPSTSVPVRADSRPVPANERWGFTIEQNRTSDTTYLYRVRWATDTAPNAYAPPRFPLGKHRIVWMLTDCSEVVKEQTIQLSITDGQPPALHCQDSVLVTLPPDGANYVFLSAYDLLESVGDNCTPPSQLDLGLRKALQPDGMGQIHGFPFDADSTVQEGVTLECGEIGTQTLFLWAKDKTGNADSCSIVVQLEGDTSTCLSDSTRFVAGHLRTILMEGVEDALVHFDLTGGNFAPIYETQTTDEDGQFVFYTPVLYNRNAYVVPSSNLDPRNGVDTWDLVLVSRHILGITPLNSPYKIIAADANGSNTVTTFDIIELRKLILGTYDSLPNSPSWRFVAESQVFTQMDNPLADSLATDLTYLGIQQIPIEDANFIGCKMGDVDFSAQPNGLVGNGAAERNWPIIAFETTDQWLEPGQTAEITFTANTLLDAYQFTLETDEVDVIPVQGPVFSEDNWGNPQNGTYTFAWHTAPDNRQKPTLTLKIKANRSGWLSGMLALSGRITPAKAFDRGNPLAPQLRFLDTAQQPVTGQFQLFQNRPNPWSGQTQISCYLPQPATPTLSIFDATGKVLYQTTQTLDKGFHTFTVQDNLPTGLLYYQIATETAVDTKAMILMK